MRPNLQIPRPEIQDPWCLDLDSGQHPRLPPAAQYPRPPNDGLNETNSSSGHPQFYAQDPRLTTVTSDESVSHKPLDQEPEP